jgi:hypothetical protein
VNLEQAIHQRWAASTSLAALLPAGNVKTGRASSGPMPYATIARERNRTVFRTNAGDALDEAEVAIDVWHDDYDAGRAIADQLTAAFDQSSFSLAGADRVVQMRRIEDSASQDAGGVWRFSTHFLVRVHLPSGI